jgi:hypothetical protein
MKKEIKIKSLYLWWRNPIKWWKDRKCIKVMNVLANYQWEHGMKEEVAKITAEAIVYGTAISKDGVRINYEDLTH